MACGSKPQSEAGLNKKTSFCEFEQRKKVLLCAMCASPYIRKVNYKNSVCTVSKARIHKAEISFLMRRIEKAVIIHLRDR